MARTFKSPDIDTLTSDKIELTNQKILDYLIQTKNKEAAQYVSFLIKNLDNKKTKTDTSKYDKLLFVNQKILKVLEEIEKNMIDEQDTSIKHLAKTSAQASAISTVIAQNETLNGSFGVNDNGNLDVSDIATGAGSMYLLKKIKDKFKKIRTTSASNKSKINKNKTTSKETIKKNKTSQKTQQKINTQQNKTIKEAEKVKKDIKKTVEKQVKDVKKQQIIKEQSKSTKTSNSNVNKNVQNASKGKKPNKTAVNNAKKAAKSINGSSNKVISKSLVKGAGKGLSKLAGPAAVAVDMAMTISDVMDANSDAERNEAITSGAASTAAGVAGAIALSWIPILGPLAGYALGSWLGNWAGKGIADLFTDPEDNIPDEVTRMGPEAELAFLDSILIPKYQNDPNIDEKDRKEDLKSLNAYKKKLQDRIAKGFTQEEQDDFALGKLEFAGVFEKNFFGDSEILDWDKLEQCSIKDLQLLIDLDDWDDDTLEKLKQIKLLKQNKESEKKQQSSTTSSIDSINKAIQAEKQNLQKAVEKQDTLEVQKVQATLESLDQAKQTALSSKEQVDKVVNVKQSALDPMKKIKVSKSSDIDYDLNTNAKVQEAEKIEEQLLKSSPMASGVGDMSLPMFDNSQISAEASQAIANMKPSNTKFNPDDGLGAISGKYESNGKPGVISSGAKDKGGKSYGAWQIASKTGTLRAYVNFAKDKYPMLTTAPLASNAFDQIWKGIAAKDPQGFLQNQYEFIKKTHYDPVYDYAVSKGLDVSNKAVCSALWSQSVQHGLAGNKIIINRALKQINGSKDPTVIIRALYSARSRYVSGLDMDADTKASVLNRYKKEVGDALSMNEQIQSGQLQNNAYEQASASARVTQNLTPVTNNTDVSTPIQNTKNETNDADINSEIQKIDNEINTLQQEYNTENAKINRTSRIRGETQFVDEEVLEQNPIKIQELQKRKQELLSQLPSVDKSASENAITAISNNMANNTVNSVRNSQTVVINNQNVQQSQNNIQRKDDVTEPNMCANAFNNNI